MGKNLTQLVLIICIFLLVCEGKSIERSQKLLKHGHKLGGEDQKVETLKVDTQKSGDQVLLQKTSSDLGQASIIFGLVVLIFGSYMIITYESVVANNYFRVEKFFKGLLKIDKTNASKDLVEEKKVILTGKTTILATDVINNRFVPNQLEQNIIVLRQKCEMYQWVEIKNPRSSSQSGEGEESFQDVKYEKKWVSHYVDSSNYVDKTKQNERKYFVKQSKSFYPKRVKIENTEVSLFDEQLEQLTQETKLPLEPKNMIEYMEEQANNFVNKQHWEIKIKDHDYVYYQRERPSYDSDLQEPQIGDFRISFTYVSTGTVTLVGQYRGGKINCIQRERITQREDQDEEIQQERVENSIFDFKPDKKYIFKQDQFKTIYSGEKTADEIKELYQSGFTHKISFTGAFIIFLGVYFVLSQTYKTLGWFPLFFQPVKEVGYFISMFLSIEVAFAISSIFWAIHWINFSLNKFKSLVSVAFVVFGLLILTDIYYEYRTN